MSNTEELQKDLQELQGLHEQAQRPKVKDILSLELRRLDTEIKRRKENGGETTSAKTTNKPTAQIKPIYTRQIDSYGWDESDKFLKLYLTLDGVESLPADKVLSEFDTQSVKLKVTELKNFNYELRIVNLLHPIIPEDSYVKIKTGSVLVMLKKAEAGQKWGFVTQQERKVKDKPSAAPKMDTDDPNAGMMNMLQKMYDEGDDDMKRTISKAMYDSKNKTGAAGDMPPL